MLVVCPNCEFLLDEVEADFSFRDGFEEHRQIWIKDYAIRCPGCRVVIAKTDSNTRDCCKEWDFHRIGDLSEVTEVKPEEFDGVLARIRRYKLMHAELDKMLSSVREGEVVYRFKTSKDVTALAVCCNLGVIQTFSTLVSV